MRRSRATLNFERLLGRITMTGISAHTCADRGRTLHDTQPRRNRALSSPNARVTRACSSRENFERATRYRTLPDACRLTHRMPFAKSRSRIKRQPAAIAAPWSSD